MLNYPDKTPFNIQRLIHKLILNYGYLYLVNDRTGIYLRIIIIAFQQAPKQKLVEMKEFMNEGNY